MVKISTLTPEQEAQLSVYCDKWLAIGLTTGPADLAKATLALDKIYKQAELKTPTTIFHVCDPIQGVIAAMILTKVFEFLPKAKDKTAVREDLTNSDFAKMAVVINEQVRPTLVELMERVLGGSFTEDTAKATWETASNLAYTKINGMKSEDVKTALNECINHLNYGNHDANWLSFYDYFKQVCNVDGPEKLEGLIDLAQCCGWWAPYTDVVIIQDRPSELHFDDQQRLHNETGPTVVYTTGLEVYTWHGLRVDKSIIMDEVTLERIKNEDNAELRRILIERYGFEAYLTDTGAQRLETDFVPLFVGGPMMPRMLIVDAFGDKYLYGTDGSTDRCYVMPVPRTVTTCREAHIAISGLDESKCVAQS